MNIYSIKGRNRETIQHISGDNITLKYDYDAVGQVTTVHHPNDKTTTYEYDLLGHKLKVNHPDAGEVSYTYDAAGNLLTKLTAELKKTISADAPITYTYDYERLSEVLYPKNLFNRVTYTYGKAGDKYNRAGRLALVEDASGGEAYYYGRMGEVTKTVRTVMASLADVRTYIYGATYDSWNRVRTMTYPDGEVVTYHYDAAGQVESLTSTKLGKESTIVEKVGYDKEGHTVYTKLGNGMETTYTYDKLRDRLERMELQGKGGKVMSNAYSYDAVDNILGMENSVSPQSYRGMNPAKLGGTFSHSYRYDKLDRLVNASGKAKNASYVLDIAYDVMSMPLHKYQEVDSSLTAHSYRNDYLYEDASHPTAPTQIGHEHYTYDANGNPTMVENDSLGTTRQMFWDEDNRLMVLSDNGKTSRYTYNASGERIVKSHGDMEGVYVNGAPQRIAFHETDDFTLYPASILTVGWNRFTKHYFIGSQRIASRLGVGRFNNVYGINGSRVTAGQKDYAARMGEIEAQKEEYYKSLGIAPGVPTMKGSYGDPENTGVGYNSILTELGKHDVPENWIQLPKKDGKGNSIGSGASATPGTPIAWEDPSNPENVQPGYGYVAGDTTELEETFYYHSDHLGSTSYVTDGDGNITQYDAYLPYGELLVDEHSSSESMPYKFNGKQLDDETGLYYYGARYMNPVASIWYGMDPLAESNMPIGCYNFCRSNPMTFVDPNGKDSYYTRNGKFVFRNTAKTDKIYVADNYRIVKRLKNGRRIYSFTNRETLADADLSAKAYSGIFTSELKRKGVDVRKLLGGKVSVNKLAFVWNGTSFEKVNTDSYNVYDPNGTFLTYDPTKTEGVAYAILKRLDKRFELCVNVYPLDTPEKEILSTESNIYNMLGIHEFKGHGLLNLNNADHSKILKLQRQDSSWWQTTQEFKELYKNLEKHNYEYK